MQLLFPVCGPLPVQKGGDGWIPRVLCVSGMERSIAVAVGFSLHLLICPWKLNCMEDRKWPQLFLLKFEPQREKEKKKKKKKDPASPTNSHAEFSMHDD